MSIDNLKNVSSWGQECYSDIINLWKHSVSYLARNMWLVNACWTWLILKRWTKFGWWNICKHNGKEEFSGKNISLLYASQMSMNYFIWEQSPCNSRFLRVPVIGLYFQVAWGDSIAGMNSKHGRADDVLDWKALRLIDSHTCGDIPMDKRATAKA